MKKCYHFRGNLQKLGEPNGASLCTDKPTEGCAYRLYLHSFLMLALSSSSTSISKKNTISVMFFEAKHKY